jgi:hypothetical protein
VPRSSIIISDEPLSRETNYRTEFVAVLSNQPQGGFITRKPTPPEDGIPVASAGGWGQSDTGGGFFNFFQPNPPPPPPPGYQRQRGGQYWRPAQQQPQQQGWRW